MLSRVKLVHITYLHAISPELSEKCASQCTVRKYDFGDGFLPERTCTQLQDKECSDIVLYIIHTSLHCIQYILNTTFPLLFHPHLQPHA